MCKYRKANLDGFPWFSKFTHNGMYQRTALALDTYQNTFLQNTKNSFGRIILMWVYIKNGARVGFICLRIGSSGGLL